MARETVAQRNARFAAEREAYQAAKEAEYPTVLLDILERATKLNYELKVVEAKFVVREWNTNATWAMTPLYTEDSQDALESLVYDVESEEEKRAEQERLYLAKQTALAKLTPEERKLLNLV